MSHPTRIILASASPRRQAFLQALGLEHEVLTADIDETPFPGELPAALALRLATAKARAVAERLAAADPTLEPDGTARGAGCLILAADTVVAIDDQLLGKPTDAAEARTMLASLRGRTHHVISAISILETGEGHQQSRINDTLVTMRVFTNDEIEAYIDTGDPFDKAGAYAIQHPDFAPVEALAGCIAGVIGLPLADLRDLLAEFGVPVLAPLPPICQAQAPFACCQAGAGDGRQSALPGAGADAQ